VKYDAEGTPFIDGADALKLTQGALDAYHNQVIAPNIPAVESVQRQQYLNSTVGWLQENAPDLIQGKDPVQLANLAAGLYNSELNPGTDDISKSTYVLNNLRGMYQPAPGQQGTPMESIGAPRRLQPVNQTGRTESGAPPVFPYPPGSTITIKRYTAHDVGLDKQIEQTAEEARLRELNMQYNLGYKFEEKSPY
jgi:hypothetical protein